MLFYMLIIFYSGYFRVNSKKLKIIIKTMIIPAKNPDKEEAIARPSCTLNFLFSLETNSFFIVSGVIISGMWFKFNYLVLKY